MTFTIALSGLNAATKDLNATANNIANVNTTGFKRSRAEFSSVFPISSYGVSSNATGIGTRLSRVAQQFEQGSINYTQNALDLAISGEGFFTVSDGGARAYTRAGAFGTDNNGHVVNASGQRLQVFPPVSGATGFDTSRLTDLRLSVSDNPPSATGGITAGVNLPANAQPPANGTFDAEDPTSYNFTRSLTVYDSLGVAHSANLYFVKGAGANAWDVRVRVDDADVGGANAMTFSGSGQLLTPAGGALTLPDYDPANGASPMTLELDLGAATQFGESFGVNDLTQDGYATGRLIGVEVTQEGIVQARYTNGQATPLGQLALATFPNPQGLQQLGDSAWAETYAAGAAILGPAGSSNLGLVQAGALEGSNVDLTEQLVNMITAQRNFQANAQMISTADQITQTIINLR